MGIIAPERALTLPGRPSKDIPFDVKSVVVLTAPTFRWADQLGAIDASEASAVTADISGYYFASNEVHHRSEAWLSKVREAGLDTGFQAARLSAARAKTSALYAGLGVYRMNTLLYTGGSGSYTTIQVFAISEYLDRDQPSPCGNPQRADLAPGCHDCRRCADACPTGALDGEGGINIDRCLRKHMFSGKPAPIEYRRLMDRRLLGCEICQTVCPMQPRTIPARPREAAPRFTIGELLTSSPETIEALARAIGSNYAKTVRVQAQAAIIAGNVCLREYLPTLAELSESDDEAVSEHARWAADRIRYGCPD
jgi:epoxyqueuosine reductase QueG